MHPEILGCILVSKEDKTKKAEVEAAPADGEAEAAPKKKGIGLIPMVIAAVVVAGAAGGAAFVLAPSGSSDTEHADSDDADHADDKKASKADSHGEEKKKKKKADKGHGGGDSDEDAESIIKPVGEIQHYDYATFLVLEPIIVSIQPIGRSKHLKVSLVLETDDDGAYALLNHGFYIQDVLNTFLRSVDAEVLEDPASMTRLRVQILRRVRAIVPDASVNNVLITEFVLT